MKRNLIVETIDRALESAGLRREGGLGGDVRHVIDRALRAAGLASGPTPAPARHQARTSDADVVDGQPATRPGQLLTRTHRNALGQRDYRLHVPAAYDGSPMPLIVMLHGCKQNPDDFLAGTRMNEHADRHGFLVAYPAQTIRANGANCWNWFETAQQVRQGAEPSLIAGIATQISEEFAVREKGVFIAGLSAGASMAVIVASAYPEMFAGVAAHSGLPIGAAHDVSSAFSAMQGRAAPSGRGLLTPSPVRTIVFHGDADHTVAVSNGQALVEDAVRAFEQRGERLQKLTRLGVEARGRECTTTEFSDESGLVVVEHWIVHGASHAWSGGSSDGSYTDTRGPDASEEIVRFFLSPR